MDIEAYIIDRLVTHYARRLAQAYSAGDHQAVNEIKEYILGNYGRDGLNEVAERAMNWIVSR